MKKPLFFLLLLTPFLLAQVEVSTRLQRTIQNSKPTDYIKGIVFLRQQVDVEALDARLYQEKASLETRANEVITQLQSMASRTQGNLLRYFEQLKTEQKIFSYQSFWIANMIQIEARPEVFQSLMNSMDVAQLDLDALLQYDRPVTVATNTEHTEGVEPGLKIINADKLWRMGITGQGRIVMNIDTGVEKNHPAINYKWRGTHVPANQAWFDPAGTTTPTDCDGHGTHTVGTMCGVSPTTGDTVGVAIGAEWIAAKTICSSPHTSNSVAAFQWAMNPDGNPSTVSDMPDAISCSWYDPDVTDECNGIYKTTLNAVEAVGIAVVFSAGNNGPSASTITKPKNINTDETNVFCTAAINGATYLGGSNDPVSSFSSRGPSACGGTGSLLIKPEVSAPGENVRSSYPPTGYSSLSGTSMASPHIAGAIALLRSFAPGLTGKQIKLALYNTAKDLGAVGEDNTYGKGLIDVYAAFLTLGTPDTLPPTRVTNLSVIEPTSNVLKLTWTAPSDTSPSGVTEYKIRYSTSPITDTTSFNNGTPVVYDGVPRPAGQTEVLLVKNLTPNTTYYFALRARDVWNNWSLMSNVAQGTTLGAPVVLVTPDSLKKVLLPQMVVTDSVMVKNNAVVPSTLDYTVELVNNTFPGKVSLQLVPVNNESAENVQDKNNPQEHFGQSIEGSGGPDSAGYKWIDSDEPNGPAYVWEDITATGTRATNWTATGTFAALDEGYAGPFPLGFNFKFYRQTKTQIYISSNGVLLFNAPTSNIFTNATIPTIAVPNEYIAPFWDDLDGRTQGTVHYKQDGSRFIVQYTNWQKYSATGSLTFQIVLYSSGKIMYYYNNMNATLNSATVGTENATGTTGLLVAYNATYVKNNLAVKISSEPDWVGTTNLGGTLYNGNSAAVKLTFRSEDFPAGNYSMDLKVKSNDPTTPVKTIPIKMTLNNPLLPITVTAPNGGETWQVGATKNITWNSNGVTNVAIKYSTNSGTSWTPIVASVPAASGTYAWTVPATPSTQCKVRISNADADTTFDVSDNVFTISAGLITWQSPLTVKDNGNLSQALAFGTSSTATNGIDAGLGEYSLPPAPPAGNFDARLELPITPVDYSYKDYRRDTLQSATWVVKFQPGASGYPMTFTWTPATLPAGNFSLKDAVTGTIVNVDMKANSTYTLTNTGVTQLKIEYTQQLSVPMTMAAGWNMASVPLQAADMGSTAVFSGANSSVFGYNNGYVTMTTLEVGKGYWVRYPAATNFNLSGNPVSVTTVPLMSGWNMVGPYHNNATVANITTTPTGIINSSFFGFNNGYVVPTILEKGKGYWVRTSAAGVMNLPASEVAKSGDDNRIEKDYARIIITDAAGNSMTLYALPTAQNGFDLPPVPPAGIFDVRFASDRMGEVLSGKQDIRINSAVYPIVVRVEGTMITLRDKATAGKLLNQTIYSGQSVTIANSGVSMIEVSSSSKPTEYALAQNYPNPFNPSTVISYQIPVNGLVTLKVYDAIGTEVATLVNSHQESGSYNVTFDASKLNSGVYFYTLRSGDFSATKKLLLVK